MPKAQAASTGTWPVTFRPILGQHPQVIEKAFAPIRDSQCICVSLFEPWRAVRPLAERPFPGLFEPELAKKILIERAVEKVANGVVIRRDQPVFPDRNAAIAIGIDMSLRLTRDSAADLKDLGFLTRIELGQLNPDIEVGEGPAGGRDDIPLKYEIVALDMNFRTVSRSAQLRLVKSDRSLDFLQRQQLG